MVLRLNGMLRYNRHHVYRGKPNSYMNRFYRAPLILMAWQQLFLFSSLHVPGGGVLSGFVTSQTREVTRCSPYKPCLLALNCHHFKRRYLRLH